MTGVSHLFRTRQVPFSPVYMIFAVTRGKKYKRAEEARCHLEIKEMRNELVLNSIKAIRGRDRESEEILLTSITRADNAFQPFLLGFPTCANSKGGRD